MDEQAVDYYQILDVKPNATPEVVRQSYIRAKNAYRRNSLATYSLFDEDDTQRELKLIEEAYMVLSDPVKREQYDRSHKDFQINMPEMPAATAPAPQQSSAPTPAAEDPQDEFDLLDATGFASVEETDNSFDSVSSTQNSFSAAEAAEQLSMPEPTAAAEPVVEQTADHTSTSSLAERLGANSKIEIHGEAPSSLVSPFSRPPSTNKFFEKDDSIEKEIEATSFVDGGMLKKIREYKKVSIEEMKNFTKLSKRYLNAIETDDTRQLPAEVFVRGFVVQYAKALKIDDQKFARLYMENFRSIRGGQAV